MSEVHQSVRKIINVTPEKEKKTFFTRKNQKKGEEDKAVKDEKKKSRIKSPKRNHEESFFLHIINAVGSH